MIGFIKQQKRTAAMQMLVYGRSADLFDEFIRLEKSTAVKRLI